MQDVWVLKSVFFFIFWSRDLPHNYGVTEEEPLNLCLTHSQTFVIVSPRSICILANFSEAEF